MLLTVMVALAELASAQTRELAIEVPSLGTQSVERREAPDLLPRPTPMEPLHNPRTGVTCTMQVLRAFPADPDSVRPAPSPVDPGIRGKRVSPCVD